MKAYKIVLASFAVAVLLTVIVAVSTNVRDIGFYFGMSCLSTGLACFLAALFTAFLEDKSWSKGFIMSCGCLILIGFATCTSDIGHIK